METNLKIKLALFLLILFHVTPGFEQEFTSLAKQLFSCPDVDYVIPNTTGSPILGSP